MSKKLIFLPNKEDVRFAMTQRDADTMMREIAALHKLCFNYTRLKDLIPAVHVRLFVCVCVCVCDSFVK